MNILDELAVPQPPYRMPRPQAVLAMAGETPIEPTADEPMPAVVPEQVPGTPEQAERSVAETAGEVLAAIEGRADAARAQIEQAPPLPEEPAQGPANTQQARGDVDAATADAAARVQAAAARSYETLEDFERERDRLAAIAKENPDSPRGKIAMKGAVLLGPRISEMRAKREEEAAAAAESALRAEQEERARKEDIEFKKSVTRAQTAALKEDAAREEQKLAAGIEFPQQEETAAQRAGRLGREALDALNDFRNAQDRGAKPEEVEFARQRAAIAQEQADAAKRGEPIPTVRVDMKRVEGQGQERYRRDIRAAQSFEQLYGALRSVGAGLVDSRGTPLDIEQQIALLEHFRMTGEILMEVPGVGVQRPTRALGILSKAQELRRMEKAVGTAPEPTPSISSTEESQEAATQERATGEGMPEARSTEAVPTTAESVPTPEATPEAPPSAVAPETEPKAIPTAEASPAESEKDRKIARLEEALATALRSLREAKQVPGPETGAKAPERAAAPEKVEGAPKPGGAEEAIMREIAGQVAEQERPSWFGQQWLKFEALKSEAKAQWHGIWAKRCKDLLKKRNAQLKDWETSAAAFKERSYVHTALGILTHDPVVWALKKSAENFSRRLENRETQQKRHENERADFLNFAAAREDASRKVSEQRAKAEEEAAKVFDKKIDAEYAAHRVATSEYAQDPSNLDALERSRSIERKLQILMKARALALKKHAKTNLSAAKKQEHQNLLLGLIDLPKMPAYSGMERRKEEVRKKSKQAA